jgi:hypothetical protein
VFVLGYEMENLRCKKRSFSVEKEHLDMVAVMLNIVMFHNFDQIRIENTLAEDDVDSKPVVESRGNRPEEER